LNFGGSLFNTTIQGNIKTKLPKIPLEIEGSEFSLKNNPPEIGEDTVEILKAFGYLEEEIEGFVLEKIIA
jgi:crotonobetainyl-CoA:carnitine CoA-transferase CaiB-like acyl-CoA transferase